MFSLFMKIIRLIVIILGVNYFYGKRYLNCEIYGLIIFRDYRLG